MLKRFFLFGLLALLVPTMTACDSGDGDGDGNGNGNNNCDTGTMTATADGSAFASECVVVAIENGILTVTGIANIDGSTGANQETITLGGVPAAVGAQTPGVATYALAPNANPSDITVCASSAIVGAPMVTIDAIDDNSASGTFAFTAICPNDGTQVTVANGQFDVSN